VQKTKARQSNAAAREAAKDAEKTLALAEAEIAKLTKRRSEIESAMFDPSSATKEDAKLTMSELSKLRGQVEKAIETAEAKWLAASELVAG
jgi:ATP-binding cassette, subfamily F, member 3